MKFGRFQITLWHSKWLKYCWRVRKWCRQQWVLSFWMLSMPFCLQKLTFSHLSIFVLFVYIGVNSWLKVSVTHKVNARVFPENSELFSIIVFYFHYNTWKYNFDLEYQTNWIMTLGLRHFIVSPLDDSCLGAKIFSSKGRRHNSSHECSWMGSNHRQKNTINYSVFFEPTDKKRQKVKFDVICLRRHWKSGTTEG